MYVYAFACVSFDMIPTNHYLSSLESVIAIMYNT